MERYNAPVSNGKAKTDDILPFRKRQSLRGSTKVSLAGGIRGATRRISRLLVILGHPSFLHERLVLPVSPFPNPHIRRESGRSRARARARTKAPRVRPVAGLLFHAQLPQRDPTGDELFLVNGGLAAQYGDKRQIPAAGDELSLKGKEERNARRATRVVSPGYLRVGVKGRGCSVSIVVKLQMCV